MKVSIITVVLNNKNFIENCINSVLSQSYKDIEYIIIDGGSSDGTVDLINKYSARIAITVIEKDNGIFDAMNKGIRRATGNVIGFLHADDLFYNNFVIEKVAKVFIDKNVDAVYGNLIYVAKSNTERIIRFWCAGSYSTSLATRGWMPPHPAFFVKKSVYEKFGYFNTDFKISSDYELMLRFLYKYKVSWYYINEILVKMRMGGFSNRNLLGIAKKSFEDYRIGKLFGFGIGTILMKNIRKIPQFFERR